MLGDQQNNTIIRVSSANEAVQDYSLLNFFSRSRPQGSQHYRWQTENTVNVFNDRVITTTFLS